MIKSGQGRVFFNYSAEAYEGSGGPVPSTWRRFMFVTIGPLIWSPQTPLQRQNFDWLEQRRVRPPGESWWNAQEWYVAWQLLLPQWFVALLLATPAASALLRRVAGRRRARRRLLVNQCLNCGYDLRGSESPAGACPECGTQRTPLVV
jgi:hypothetical protein